jgi:uncharacterized protein (TIGR00369 family)
MAGKLTRCFDFDEPGVTAAAALGRPGIEFLNDVIAGKVPAAPIQATLGYQLVEVSDGFARFELTPGDHLYGSANAVHGGVAATLLDSAMTAAVTTTLDAATGYTTATLTVHLTRAITSRTVKVTAEGWVVHRGRRLVTAEGRLTDEQGRLLAHGSATCAHTERAGSGSSPTGSSPGAASRP